MTITSAPTSQDSNNPNADGMADVVASGPNAS